MLKIKKIIILSIIVNLGYMALMELNIMANSITKTLNLNNGNIEIDLLKHISKTNAFVNDFFMSRDCNNFAFVVKYLESEDQKVEKKLVLTYLDIDKGVCKEIIDDSKILSDISNISVSNNNKTISWAAKDKLDLEYFIDDEDVKSDRNKIAKLMKNPDEVHKLMRKNDKWYNNKAGSRIFFYDLEKDKLVEQWIPLKVSTIKLINDELYFIGIDTRLEFHKRRYSLYKLGKQNECIRLFEGSTNLTKLYFVNSDSKLYFCEVNPRSFLSSNKNTIVNEFGFIEKWNLYCINNNELFSLVYKMNGIEEKGKPKEIIPVYFDAITNKILCNYTINGNRFAYNRISIINVETGDIYLSENIYNYRPVFFDILENKLHCKDNENNHVIRFDCKL
jgi:hypothetical protein